jgi:hypothetical protein
MTDSLIHLTRKAVKLRVVSVESHNDSLLGFQRMRVQRQSFGFPGNDSENSQALFDVC